MKPEHKHLLWKWLKAGLSRDAAHRRLQMMIKVSKENHKKLKETPKETFKESFETLIAK